MSVVANLVVRITAATTDFEKDLKGLQGKWNRVGSQLESAGATLTKGLTVPILGGAAAALKFSTDFETAMTKVQTLSNNSAAEVAKMRQGVLALSPAVGKGPQELAAGLLVITSTGLKGADAMAVLEASAKASAVGLGNITDVARAITAAVNAYGTSNLTAARAADILFQTVVEGGAEASDLAGELGRVFGVAQQLGVSFEEVGAFVATYTRLGLNASEATTGLYGALNSILDPSKEAKDALASVGLSANQLRQEVKEKGLGEALIGLLGKLKDKGGVEAIAAVFGNVRALGGVLGTAGAQAEQYRQIIENIATSQGKMGAAFQVWGGTTAATWAKFTAGAQVAFIAIGDQLAPAFSRMLTAAMPLIDLVVKMVEWFAKLPQPIQTASLGLIGFAAAAGPIAYAAGSVYKLGAAFAGLLRYSGVAAFIGKMALAVQEFTLGATGVIGPWQTALGYFGQTARVLAPLIGVFGAVIAIVGGLLYAVKELTGSWTTAFLIILPPVGLLMVAWQQLTAGFNSSKEVFQSIWNIISDLATIVRDTLTLAVENFIHSWNELLAVFDVGEAKSQISELSTAIRDGLGGAIAWVGEQTGLDKVFSVDVARQQLTEIGGYIKSVLSDAIDWVANKFKWLFDQLPKVPSLKDIEKKTGAASGRTVGDKEQQAAFDLAFKNRPKGIIAETSVAVDDLNHVLQITDDQIKKSARSFVGMGEAGAGAAKKIKAELKLLDSSRALPNDQSAGAYPGAYTGVQMGGGSNLGGLMDQFRNTLQSGSRIQEIANQAGLSGAPYVASQGKAIQEALAATIADNAAGVADSVRSAFQYFSGVLSPALAGVLGGFLNIFEKGLKTEGSFLQKLFGGKGGKKVAAGLDIGLGAFSGGFGLGEQFGTGKGALAGAASGALSGALAGSVVPVIGTAIGGIIGGIAGLIGGIFGGKKKHKEELAKMGEAKAQLLEQFGGMEKLQATALRAGVSVDLLFSTDKAKVFQAELTKVTEAIKVMQERIATTVSDIDKVMSEGGLIGKQLWQNILKDSDAEEIKAKLAEVFSASVDRSAEGFNKIATNFELLKAPLSEIGVLADAAFAGLIANGASIPEAIAQMGDGLAHIQEILAQSGQTATGPLAEILNFQKITEANKGLFELLSGVDDMLTGLGNSGLLTQERFAALGMTITQAFGQLTAQGVAGSTALELMQPQLQKLWEAQQLFGLQTDAATQSLINQAVQQGIVGENMKGVNEQILDVLKAIATALGAEIPGALQTMAGAAGVAVDAITPKFQALKDQASGLFSGIPNHIPIEFNMRLTGEMPPGTRATQIGGSPGGILAPNDPRLTGGYRALATGGIVTRPTFAMVGEDGPEAVVPLDEYHGAGGVVNITVNGTADRAFAKTLAREINRGGDVRTAWEVALR